VVPAGSPLADHVGTELAPKLLLVAVRPMLLCLLLCLQPIASTLFQDIKEERRTMEVQKLKLFKQLEAEDDTFWAQKFT
jgi:hypothetical protein